MIIRRISLYITPVTSSRPLVTTSYTLVSCISPGNEHTHRKESDMKIDMAAIQSEIEHLDARLDGIQIEDLLCMELVEFCIFSLDPADLELAQQILMLATRGDKQRAEEMEQALLARIKKQLFLAWGRREWLLGMKAGNTSAI